jgi:hypothetical protein
VLCSSDLSALVAKSSAISAEGSMHSGRHCSCSSCGRGDLARTCFCTLGLIVTALTVIGYLCRPMFNLTWPRSMVAVSCSAAYGCGELEAWLQLTRSSIRLCASD